MIGDAKAEDALRAIAQFGKETEVVASHLDGYRRKLKGWEPFLLIEKAVVSPIIVCTEQELAALCSDATL